MKKIASLIFALAFAFFVIAPGVFALDCSADGSCVAGYTAQTDPTTSKCTCVNIFGGNDVSEIGTSSGLGNTTLTVIVGNIVKAVLGLFGIIATVIIVFGGVKWMTSQGDQEKIESAKKIMIAGGVGMLLIVSGYAITQFLISNVLMKAVGA